MKAEPRHGAASGEGRPLRVETFREPDSVWDDWLRVSDSGTFCHLAGWRRIMGETMDQEPLYLVARDSEGSIHGLLPLVRVRSRLFGDYLLSMPFLSYGGALGSRDARGSLERRAVEYARDLGVDLLELRSRTPPSTNLAVSTRKVTVLLDLPEDPETLWQDGLRSKVRSQVRRPMKEGMTTSFGVDLLERFYAVFARTMRDLGTPVLPWAFFAGIAREFPDHVVCCVVEHKGVAVAAGCGFLWRKEVEITWAGASRDHSRMAPNMLLYWSMMRWAVEHGASTFNFGRCTPGSGTHRFKRQWGGRDHVLPWAQWAGGSRAATPSPGETKYGLARAVWRRLPLSVANRLGPILSRSLP